MFPLMFAVEFGASGGWIHFSAGSADIEVFLPLLIPADMHSGLWQNFCRFNWRGPAGLGGV